MAEGSSGSSTQTHPAWTRLLLPAVSDLIFLAVFAALVFTPLSVRLLNDAGIGWHIRTGQLIVQTHAVPRVDPFSSTMQGRPWFAWEWLYDCVVGWIESASGLNGIVVFHAAIIALVFSLTFRLLRRRNTSICVAFGLTLLAIAASMIHFLARPHVVSWLFAVLWLAWLDAHARTDGRTQLRALWILPVSMLLWVNIHGGFVVGFVLLGAFVIGNLVEWNTLRRVPGLAAFEAGTRLHRQIYAGIVSAVATLVNPYGWHLHAHIYRYLSDRWLMNHVQEFQSPDFHDPAVKCFLVLIVVTLLAFAWRKQTVGITNLLLVIFAVASGLYSARNVPFSAILLAFISGPLLTGMFARSSFSLTKSSANAPGVLLRLDRVDASLRGHMWPALLVALTVGLVVAGKSASLIDAHFDSHRFPEAAVRELKAQSDNRPVFAPDYWGGYLIYELYPQRRVVIDDRHDMYGASLFKQYLNTYRFEAGWKDFIEGNKIDLIIVPKDGALAQGLLLDPQWRAVERDDVAITFRRNSTSAAQ